MTNTNQNNHSDTSNLYQKLTNSPIKPGQLYTKPDSDVEYQILYKGFLEEFEDLAIVFKCNLIDYSQLDAEYQTYFLENSPIWIENINKFIDGSVVTDLNLLSSLAREIVNSPIKPGQLYKHTRTGNIYKILHIGINLHEKNVGIIYQDVDTEKPFIWIRGVKVFIQNVQIDGVTMPRFINVS